MKDAQVVELVKNLTELGKTRLRVVGEVNPAEVRDVLDENSTRGHLVFSETAEYVGPLVELDLRDGAVEVWNNASGAEALFFQPPVGRDLASEEIVFSLWVFPRCSFPRMILGSSQGCLLSRIDRGGAYSPLSWHRDGHGEGP